MISRHDDSKSSPGDSSDKEDIANLNEMIASLCKSSESPVNLNLTYTLKTAVSDTECITKTKSSNNILNEISNFEKRESLTSKDNATSSGDENSVISSKSTTNKALLKDKGQFSGRNSFDKGTSLQPEKIEKSNPPSRSGSISSVSLPVIQVLVEKINLFTQDLDERWNKDVIDGK